MKGDTEVVVMVLVALVGIFIGNYLALDHLPNWTGTLASILAVALAAISAWRSEKAAESSQASAERAYELELTRAYPFLRLENSTIGSAYFPAGHNLAHLQQTGNVLVVFLTLRNVGGTSAVIDRLHLKHTGEGRSTDVSISDFVPHTMPDRSVHYTPVSHAEPVVIEPGHSGTVGAWFPDAPRGRQYIVTTKADSFPPVSMSFQPIPAGGTTIQAQPRRRPIDILKEWINEQ